MLSTLRALRSLSAEEEVKIFNRLPAQEKEIATELKKHGAKMVFDNGEFKYQMSLQKPKTVDVKPQEISADDTTEKSVDVARPKSP